MKIARAATGRPAVVVLDHAYHGRTLMTMSMTAKNVPYKEGFGPFAPRGVPGADGLPPTAGRWPRARRAEALAALEELVLTQIGAHNVAAIVAEPIQGEGGFIVPAAGFLPGVRRVRPRARHRLRRRRDPDRIRSAPARCSPASTRDSCPDLVTTAKALAGGLPLSAVTGRAEIMDAVDPGGARRHVRRQPGRLRGRPGRHRRHRARRTSWRARDIEERPAPARLAGAAPVPVGTARGRGAMLAIEFVRPGTTARPGRRQGGRPRCHRQGVLVLICGTFGNVIRLLPPLVIDDDLLDDALAVIEDAVGT